jgi:DNA-binding NarL/FixJ family response regulator
MKILLIEDNRADARLFEIMLRHMESSELPSLIWAKTLEEGLTTLVNDSEIDIVFTDLGLPDSFGTGTLEKVRNGAGMVPVIVLSGDDDDSRAQEMIIMGASECLSKNSIDEQLLEQMLTTFARPHS